jgi:malate dehydrogenase (quinone)
VRYLIGQLAASSTSKFDELREFVPNADPKDWYRITAGQRVQVIKKDPKKIGVLQFGTEVVAAADGSIAGLLGASPGASTAVPIMLDLIAKCFPDRMDDWKPTLASMIPSYGVALSDNPEFAAQVQSATAKALHLTA